MINDADHLVQVLVICVSSLQKCLFRFPAGSFPGLFDSFALELCELLCILKTDPLLVTSFANIMLPPTRCRPIPGLLIGGKFAPCRTVGNVWEHLGVSHRWGVSRLASGEPRPGCPHHAASYGSTVQHPARHGTAPRGQGLANPKLSWRNPRAAWVSGVATRFLLGGL